LLKYQNIISELIGLVLGRCGRVYTYLMEEFHGIPVQNVYMIWSLHILYSYEAFPVWSGKQHNSWLPFLKFLRPCVGLLTRVAGHWFKNLHDTFLNIFYFSPSYLCALLVQATSHSALTVSIRAFELLNFVKKIMDVNSGLLLLG